LEETGGVDARGLEVSAAGGRLCRAVGWVALPLDLVLVDEHGVDRLNLVGAERDDHVQILVLVLCGAAGVDEGDDAADLHQTVDDFPGN
jgi:hypothetical protein